MGQNPHVVSICVVEISHREGGIKGLIFLTHRPEASDEVFMVVVHENAVFAYPRLLKFGASHNPLHSPRLGSVEATKGRQRGLIQFIAEISLIHAGLVMLQDVPKVS